MKWKPSLVLNNNKDFMNELKLKNYTIKQDDKNMLYSWGAADPFIFRNYLFCELLDNRKKLLGLRGGVICCSPLQDELDFKIIIKENFHLSYPHIFTHRKKIYMIPETYEANKLLLYECLNFPYEWQQKTVLKNNFSCIDSTIFSLDRRLYLFTTKYIRSNKKQNITYLFKINNLLNSKLRLIKKNILPPRYRGGGNTFTNNNNLYIPIQPSEVNFYGQRLCIYRIKKIENNEIVFEYCYDVKIPSIYRGIHHLSNHDNIFICDICS